MWRGTSQERDDGAPRRAQSEGWIDSQAARAWPIILAYLMPTPNFCLMPEGKEPAASRAEVANFQAVRKKSGWRAVSGGSQGEEPSAARRHHQCTSCSTTAAGGKASAAAVRRRRACWRAPLAGPSHTSHRSSVTRYIFCRDRRSGR